MSSLRNVPVRVLPLLALFGLGACGTEPDPTTEDAQNALTSAMPRPLTIQGVAPARPVPTTDGKRHLVYELFATNVATQGTRITRIDVVDPECAQTPLASYTGDALTRLLLIDAGDVATGTIAAGAHAAVFLDLAFPAATKLPSRLAHRISTAPAVEIAGRTAVVAGPVVAVIAERARPVSPPLRGSNLLDLNGCCRSIHTRALLQVGTGLFVAQRYAIDFVRLSDEGELYDGDPAKNDSYFIYGNEILAAGPGRIVAVRDGMAENVPTLPLPPATLESAPGNYVVEALEDGRFALYAHLQPGSPRVHVGDRVRRGQVLGLVGNSGNSTWPHLHFHITDGPSPLGSNGLPYVFDRFDLQATIDLEAPDAEVVFTPPPQQRHDLLPKSGDILAFP